MRTNVALTSIAAYHDIQADGTEARQIDRVLAHIEDCPGCTRKEIAVALRIDPGSVAPRVATLLTDEQIVEGEPRRCAISGRTVKTLWAKPLQFDLAS